MEEKIIHGTYYIADCESRSDIARAKAWLRNILPNVRITMDYWNGYDCGEAYINFEFSSKHFQKVYSALSDVATFDADINDYITLPITSICRNVACSRDKYNTQMQVLANNFDNGWEENVPVDLFFEHNNNFAPLLIIERAKQALPENHKMIAYYTDIVDGNQFHHVLFTCSLKDIDNKKLEDFGNYALSFNRKSFLKRNGIYGEMRVCHKKKKVTTL